MMRPYVVPSSSPASAPVTERDIRHAALSDTLPDTVPALADADSELEDTLPSCTLPPLEEEAFYEAPTLPGMHLSDLESPELPRAGTSVRDGQWDRVLSLVAHAVRRVFAVHSA